MSRFAAVFFAVRSSWNFVAWGVLVAVRDPGSARRAAAAAGAGARPFAVHPRAEHARGGLRRGARAGADGDRRPAAAARLGQVPLTRHRLTRSGRTREQLQRIQVRVVTAGSDLGPCLRSCGQRIVGVAERRDDHDHHKRSGRGPAGRGCRRGRPHRAATPAAGPSSLGAYGFGGVRCRQPSEGSGGVGAEQLVVRRTRPGGCWWRSTGSVETKDCSGRRSRRHPRATRHWSRSTPGTCPRSTTTRWRSASPGSRRPDHRHAGRHLGRVTSWSHERQGGEQAPTRDRPGSDRDEERSGPLGPGDGSGARRQLVHRLQELSPPLDQDAPPRMGEVVDVVHLKGCRLPVEVGGDDVVGRRTEQDLALMDHEVHRKHERSVLCAEGELDPPIVHL